MKLQTSLLALLSTLTGAALAAPIPLTGTMTHNENFDSLGTGDVPWVDNSTLPGWIAEINNGTTPAGNAQAADGTFVLSGLLNLGAAGAPDRALGAKTTSTNNFANIAYGLQFRNTSAGPIQLSALTYTGELWHTNTTAGGLAEVLTVFYAISNTEITDVNSGGTSATAVGGAGFNALGAGANFSSPTNVPEDSALDGNDPLNRTTITFTPISAITIAPGQYFMIKWTDTNLGGTDGFPGIDDLSIEFSEVSGLLSPTVTAKTRNLNSTPADPTDDTFGFTVNVAGSGSVGTGWTTTDVSAPNATSANYGTAVVWTGFPISGPKTVTFKDSVTPSIAAGISVDPPKIIGTNNIVTAGAPLLDTGASSPVWLIDEIARTSTENNSTTQSDELITSDVIDLSAVGFVKFSADLDAMAGTPTTTSSGFEAADGFGLELSIDGGAFFSVLGAADTDANGRLNGAAGGPWDELPDATILTETRSFSFEYLIPDTANSVQIRIIGNCNSPNETLLVKDVTLAAPSASILVTPGAVTIDNKGTTNPGDDEFSGLVTINPVGVGASTGWTSNEVPARMGLYADSQPVTFGPYLVSAGPKTVSLSDNLNPAVVSQPFTITPPTGAITASAPTNVVKNPNGTLSFDVTLTGTNAGPGWTATGATPASGAYGLVTFTIPGTLGGSVVVTDASYSGVTQTITVAAYVIGQKNLGAGLTDVISQPVVAPDTAWVNDTVARTLTMNNGAAVAAGEKTITSEVINLSGVSGPVNFTANLHVDDTSSGTEVDDTFIATLIYDGNAAAPISLITAPTNYDTDASGRMNDDELASGVGSFDYPLSATIPDNVNSVQLVITGLNNSLSETMIVQNVLFSSGPVVADSDGDGMSNTDEATAGTNPNDPLDVLRLSQTSTNPNILSFPTKSLHFYKLYSSADLGPWAPTSLPSVAGDGSAMQFDITSLITSGRRFFRVHVMSTDGPWN